MYSFRGAVSCIWLSLDLTSGKARERGWLLEAPGYALGAKQPDAQIFVRREKTQFLTQLQDMHMHFLYAYLLIIISLYTADLPDCLTVSLPVMYSHHRCDMTLALWWSHKLYSIQSNIVEVFMSCGSLWKTWKNMNRIKTQTKQDIRLSKSVWNCRLG